MKRFFTVSLSLVISAAALTGQGASPVESAPHPPNVDSIPPMPSTKPPVEAFRELLNMTPAERSHHLASRAPDIRRAIAAKLREYEAMKPEVRELRLRATELRFYLLPLLRGKPAERAEKLNAIPADSRALVARRLQEWDRLSAEQQKELLDNEATLRYFGEVVSGNQIRQVPDARKQRLQNGITQWQALPEAKRDTILARFNQFFDLRKDEQTRALRVLSDSERAQIEKTLRRFASLTPAQRSQCIRSFEKFAGLSAEERQQFLKNAARWKMMSLPERDQWRELVNQLSMQPPLPPAFPELPGRVRRETNES